MSRYRSTRREFVRGIVAGGAAATLVGTSHGAEGAQTMRRLSKEIFVPTQDGTGVFPGFVTYIHRSKPALMRRFGWVDASDTYDHFHDSFSEDNGATWTKPVLALDSHAVEGWRVRYIENAGFFDVDTGKLITLVSKMFYPDDHIDVEQPREIEINHYDPLAGPPPEPRSFDFGLPGGMGISFCFPIKTRTGRIVVPGFKQEIDGDGNVVHHPKSNMVVYEVRMVIGEYQADGTLAWHVGEPLRTTPEQSSRGLSESAPVELEDGRLALLCRGSNAKMNDVPGRKWLSFSEDGGETWAPPRPLTCADGGPIESSATGCACFRSIKNGKIYYIGNLCPQGTHADGNWPRSPLYIAEMQEEPFALKRDTIAMIDERDEDDSRTTQISNFRFYQDRPTGDIVVFATRFGERDSKKWKWADHYRYRVTLG